MFHSAVSVSRCTAEEGAIFLTLSSVELEFEHGHGYGLDWTVGCGGSVSAVWGRCLRCTRLMMFACRL